VGEVMTEERRKAILEEINRQLRKLNSRGIVDVTNPIKVVAVAMDWGLDEN
jgi:hypothetical protein